MAKIKLRKFGKRSEPLPWENDRQTQGEKIAAKIKERLKTGRWPKDRKTEPSTTAPRRKRQLVKPPALEDQFNIGNEPRGSKWWDLFKDGINNSGIGLWLQDRHQFWLRYVCGYEVPVYQDSLEFGNIFHWLIERHLKGRLSRKKDGAFNDLRGKYHREWVEGFAGTLSAKNKQTQETFYTLAAAMWPAYLERYKDHWKGREVVAVEKEFTAVHKLRDKTPITLYGTIDLITRFPEPKSVLKTKYLHLEDHKTASFINEFEIEQSLALNFQLMFYAYAEFLTSGEVVRSVSHDVIRRTASKPHKGESLKDYGRRMAREVSKSPDYFFQRFKCEVTPEKLRAYQRWIIEPILEDLAAWARGTGAHYPNPNALITRYGPCRLFTPITTGNFSGIPRKRPTTRGVER